MEADLDMTQNDTEKIGQEQLSPAKLQVLQGLLSGDSVTDAAKAGQVSRETVHRWLREDFEFQAVYNQGRREIAEEIQDVLLVTARQAADTVADAVRSGNVKLALAVLKGIGGLSGRPPNIRSGDSVQLALEADLDNREQESMNILRSISIQY